MDVRNLNWKLHKQGTRGEQNQRQIYTIKVILKSIRI